MDSGEDFGDLCRLCIAEKEKFELIAIYGKEGIDQKISEKINKHCNIIVSCSDSLPLKICKECFNVINKFSQIYESCIENEKKLKILLVERMEKVEKANSQISLLQSKESLGGVDLELILDEELQFEENNIDEFNQSGSIEIDIAKHIDRIFGMTSMDSLDGEIQPAKSYQCEFCPNEAFPSQKELNAHCYDMHLDLVFCCDHCSNFFSRNCLITHMIQHAKEENEKLLKEPEKTVTEPVILTNLNLEVQKTPEKPAESSKLVESSDKLENTDNRSNTENKSNSELKSNTENKSSKTSLKSSENVKMLKKCYYCDKLFANRAGRLYHCQQVHLNLKKFECTDCGMKFGLKSTLQNHIKNKHNTINVRSYKCNQCEKTYKTNSALYNHKTSHTDPQLSCTFCPKKFHFNFLLEQHEKLHRSDFNEIYTCGQCLKSFKTRNSLTKHKSIHTTEVVFNCQKCEYKSSLKRYLMAHVKRKH